MLLPVMFDVAVNDVAGCTMLCAGECQVCFRRCPSSEITTALLAPGGQWFSCLFVLLWKVGRSDIPSSGQLVVESWKEGYQNLLLSPRLVSLLWETWKEGYQNVCFSPLNFCTPL